MRDNGITLREYQRRVLAMDVGPEAQLYHCWARVDADGQPANLRPIPLGAQDVTAEVLAPYGRNFGVLVGHDPGQRQHVSEFLKAYRFRGEKSYRWIVVDEVPSEFVAATPYIVTIIVLAGARQQLRPPAQAGQPYRPGENH